MPRRFQKPVPDHLHETEIHVPGLWNAYLLAIGIAVVVGLVGGSAWIAWRLLIAPWLR